MARRNITGSPETSAWQKRLIPGGAIASLIVVTGYRLYAVRDAAFPGHADKSFHFNVAENLAAGRGPNIDYVWHFLAPQDDLTHYAFDYWLPLTSVLMAIPLRLFGGGVPTALSVNVVLAMVFALATFAIARALTEVRWIPWVAVVVTVLLPQVTELAVETDSAMSYWAIGALTFAVALHARTRPGLWWVAGALAGLAHLSRNDGLLLAGAVLVCAFVWSPRAVRLRRAAAAGLAYIVMLAPYMVLSIVKLGSPLPTATRYFPFITTFEDLYRTSPRPGIADLRALGLRGNLDLRLDALVEDWSDVLEANGPILSTALIGLAGVAFAIAWRERQGRWWQSSWLLPATYGLAFLTLHVVVTPVVSGGGGFLKTVTVLFPFLITLALLGLARLTMPGVVAAGLVSLLVIPPLTELSSTTRRVIDDNDDESVQPLVPVLDREAGCVSGEIVVMTRLPWQFTTATGVRSVQIPNESRPRILEEAERWNVTHLMPPQRLQIGRRDLTNLDADPRFEHVEGRLYRLVGPRTANC